VINKPVFYFFLLFPIILFSQKYEEFYSTEFDFGKVFYEKHHDDLMASANRIGESPQFLFSIVAPEVSQFNSIQNAFELNSLKILYVQGGSGYGNFSVGFFQMKPSFVETLESKVKIYKDIRHVFSFIPDATLNEKEQRKMRLYNLDSLQAQLKYLEAFCLILKKKTVDIQFSSEQDRLKYFATAYNSGFELNKNKMYSMMDKTFFPHFGENKFNYSDVSLEFYKTLFTRKKAP
jgi:hypothetical protein